MKLYSSDNHYTTAPLRIFGYRLSRARHTTENAFGILSNRFLFLSSRMYSEPKNATKITLACCVLHNILSTHSKNSYSPSGFADDVEENKNIRPREWRDRNNSAMQLLAATKSRHPSHNAEKMRDIFHEYFYGRGQPNWNAIFWEYSPCVPSALQCLRHPGNI